MITSEILINKLQKFSRYRFAHLPTPLEKMERLGIYEVAPEDFGLIDYASSSKIK